MPIIAAITDVFLQGLVQLQGITGNLGISILVFTFVMRALLVPLSLPSMKS
jgi:membrane protein insertase Oxa1/YidC/SpoIIIJ